MNHNHPDTPDDTNGLAIIDQFDQFRQYRQWRAAHDPRATLLENKLYTQHYPIAQWAYRRLTYRGHYPLNDRGKPLAKLYITEVLRSNIGLDLESNINYALLNAIKHYNPDLGAAFSTYAIKVMYNAALNTIRCYQRQTRERPAVIDPSGRQTSPWEWWPTNDPTIDRIASLPAAIANIRSRATPLQSDIIDHRILTIDRTGIEIATDHHCTKQNVSLTEYAVRKAIRHQINTGQVISTAIKRGPKDKSYVNYRARTTKHPCQIHIWWTKQQQTNPVKTTTAIELIRPKLDPLQSDILDHRILANANTTTNHTIAARHDCNYNRVANNTYAIYRWLAHILTTGKLPDRMSIRRASSRSKRQQTPELEKNHQKDITTPCQP